MPHCFVVIRSHAPAWNPGEPLRRQRLWNEHARFIDQLADRGVVRLAGPLGEDDAMLVVRGDDRAEIESIMEADPWTPAGMLVTVRVDLWSLLIGAL